MIERTAAARYGNHAVLTDGIEGAVSHGVYIKQTLHLFAVPSVEIVDIIAVCQLWAAFGDDKLWNGVAADILQRIV